MAAAGGFQPKLIGQGGQDAGLVFGLGREQAGGAAGLQVHRTDHRPLRMSRPYRHRSSGPHLARARFTAAPRSAGVTAQGLR